MNRIPDLIGVAEDADGLFTVDSCEKGIATVRRGKIRRENGEIADAVLAFVPDIGLRGIYLARYHEDVGEWQLSTGSSNPDPRIIAAVTAVIGSFPGI